MSNNPYLDLDADEDLFRSPEEETSNPEPVVIRHTYDGTSCPVCNTVHDVTIDPSAPPEVYAALDSILDTMPEEARKGKLIVTDGTIPAGEIYTAVMNRMSVLNNVTPVGPVLRAILHTLREMTGSDRVDSLINFYATEQKVLLTHSQLNMAQKVIHNIDEHPSTKEATELPHSLRTLRDLMETTVAGIRAAQGETIEAYARAADFVGEKVDESVINGTFNGADANSSLDDRLNRYFAILKDVNDSL